MFRSILGRLCTYGVVLGINALPFAVVAVGGMSVPELPPVVSIADEPEGEDDRTARWTPIPAFPTDEPAVDEPEAAPEPTPVLPSTATVTRAKGGRRGGAPALAKRAEGPAAGDGSARSDAEGEGDAKVAQKTRRGGKNSGRRKSCDQPHPNIHPGDGVVEIDRALVDEYTKNLEAFMQLGYSRPYDENGLEGWYISGFSCTSPIAKAGFKRGDVLLAVNGKKTRSWVGVFMLYQRMKNKDDFEVELVRKGEPVVLKFHVVDA